MQIMIQQNILIVSLFHSLNKGGDILTSQEQYIATIGPIVQKYAKEFGYGVPSAIIAQSCLECGYGTGIYNDNRNKVRNPITGEWRHNYFGMKYRPNRVSCHCGYFNSSGSEQNADGSYTPISTDWYKFGSMDLGVKGYFQFISASGYSKARTQTDPRGYLQALKDAGYATSLNYVNNIMKVVDRYNLTQYDDGGTFKVKVPSGTKIYAESPKVKGIIASEGTYTIVAVDGEFGKLKSGAGWVNLKSVSRE